MYFNSQCLTNKLDDLQLLLSSNPTGFPDFIFVTETWFTSDFDSAILPFASDYQIYRSDRIGRGHGGCAAMIHNRFVSQKFFSTSFLGFIELLRLKVSVKGHKLDLVLVYRSPASTIVADQALLDYLTALDLENDLITIGDFNLPLLMSADPDAISVSYDAIFSELGLCQKNLLPTRGSNVLDLLMSSDDMLVTNVRVSEPFSTSDHCSIKFNLNVFGGTQNIPVRPRRYDFARADYSGFNDYLASIDWNGLFYDNSSIDGMWDTFCHVMEYGMYQYVPVQQPRSRKSIKWSIDTLKLYARKRTLWRRYSRNKSYANKVNYYTVAKQAKSSCFQDILKQEEHVLETANLKKLYGFINSKLSSRSNIPPLRSNGRLLEEPEAKANILQDQFCSVFTHDDGKLPCFPVRTNQKLTSVEISEDIVRKTIKKLPNKSSYGPDGIPPILLKKTVQYITKPLFQIFSASLESGYLPKEWRNAKIVPIFKKKGDSSEAVNYRPVSLTPTVSKVLETVIKHKLLKFLLANKLITPKQHGFLSRRSTLTNLLASMNEWFKARLNRKNVHACYTDFSKAFDTVSHPKLLYKLSKYGITGKLFLWLSSFLSSRQQYVDVEGSSSKSCPVVSGVPQGTVLGPILFLIFINDLPDVVLNCEISLYADDSKICKAENADVVHSTALQEDLCRVHKWACEWQLTLAIQKCSVFIFGSAVGTPRYTLGDSELDVVKHVNDLGILLSSDQKFSQHCKSVSNRALFRSANIFRAFKCRKTAFLVNMYTKFVRPSVEYGVQVWSPYLLKDIDVVERVQRRFTKRIPEVRHLSYQERLKFLNLESLEYRRLTADLVLAYKILRNSIDVPFDDFFSFAPCTGTRGNDLKLHIPLAHTDVVKHSFSFRIPKFFNSLPNEIVQAPTINLFKARLSHYNLSSFLRGRGVR